MGVKTEDIYIHPAFTQIVNNKVWKRKEVLPPEDDEGLSIIGWQAMKNQKHIKIREQEALKVIKELYPQFFSTSTWKRKESAPLKEKSETSLPTTSPEDILPEPETSSPTTSEVTFPEPSVPQFVPSDEPWEE